jgi:hypothetical protein
MMNPSRSRQLQDPYPKKYGPICEDDSYMKKKEEAAAAAMVRARKKTRIWRSL